MMDRYEIGGLDIPGRVQVVDVGPRDGFQNLKEFIPTDVKLRVIDGMAAAGVKQMEITSFVNPRAVPQMADAGEVAKATVEKYGESVRLIALVPNARGAENAMQSGLRDITYVISVSESHNKANVNRTVAESLDSLKGLVAAMPELTVRLSVATAFGCPFEGKTPYESVKGLVGSALELGIREIALCDTIGVANPRQVMELVGEIRPMDAGMKLALHLHDTRGMGLANTLAGLIAGVRIYETAIGGLGGCPFAPGASGNTATEDMLNMFGGMQIETGIDPGKYMEAVRIVQKDIQPELSGHVANVKSL